jgi:23S rRNA pseudouridine2605 synthase
MSEGLILVTNDGDLANLLAHPRYGVEKKYLVQVAGVPSPDTLDKLRRGIQLAEGTARAQHVSLKSQHKQSAVLEMVLDEGKNREIRRMLAQLGHKVHQLKRVAVGQLSLGGLLPGQHRLLAWSEIDALRRDALAHVGSARPAVDSGRPRGRRPDGRPERFDRQGRGARGTGGPPRQRPGGRDDDRGSRPPRPAPRPRKRPGKASTWRKQRG